MLEYLFDVSLAQPFLRILMKKSEDKIPCFLWDGLWEGDILRVSYLEEGRL
jgi:hypothetical protein